MGRTAPIGTTGHCLPMVAHTAALPKAGRGGETSATYDEWHSGAAPAKSQVMLPALAQGPEHDRTGRQACCLACCKALYSHVNQRCCTLVLLCTCGVRVALVTSQQFAVLASLPCRQVVNVSRGIGGWVTTAAAGGHMFLLAVGLQLDAKHRPIDHQLLSQAGSGESLPACASLPISSRLKLQTRNPAARRLRSQTLSLSDRQTLNLGLEAQQACNLQATVFLPFTP